MHLYVCETYLYEIIFPLKDWWHTHAAMKSTVITTLSQAILHVHPHNCCLVCLGSGEEKAGTINHLQSKQREKWSCNWAACEWPIVISMGPQGYIILLYNCMSHCKATSLLPTAKKSLLFPVIDEIKWPDNVQSISNCSNTMRLELSDSWLNLVSKKEWVCIWSNFKLISCQ